MKTIWIVLIIIVALALAYFAYIKLVKTESKDSKSTLASIDCTKYWSLNTIDKQYCKDKGLAPPPPVLTQIELNTGSGTSSSTLKTK